MHLFGYSRAKLVRLFLARAQRLLVLPKRDRNCFAGLAAATGPPTSDAATQAFGRWLHGRYGSVNGYWTCPTSQRYENRIDSLAEVHVAKTRHLTAATATLSGAHVVFSRVRDSAWVRRWSPYSRHYLIGPQSFKVPGTASENSPAFDWAFIAQGAAGGWQRHRTFHVDGYDG